MYELYAKTKANLKSASYAGINICNPAAALLAHLFFDPRSTKKKIRRALRLVTLTPNYSCREALQGDAFIWHCDRDDQTRLALDIAQSMSQQKALSCVSLPGIKDDAYKSLDWSAMYAALKLTLSCRQPWLERLYIFGALCYTIKQQKAIQKHAIVEQLTSLVSFNSANIPECFLANACRQRGVRTYSLQHGLYHRYRNERPIDILNYDNVTAHTLLVWSAFCRDEISRYHDELGETPGFEMTIAGYINPARREKAPPQPDGKTRILCLLPGKRYVADCIALLETLGKLPEHYELTVRLHPLLADDWRIRHAMPPTARLDAQQTLAQTLAQQPFDLAIGFNTTSLFEALLFDVPCALYHASSLNLEVDGLPSFASAEELRTLHWHSQQTRELADYLLGASLFRYGEIISGDVA